MGLATHGEVENPQVFLDGIAEGFVQSVPREEIASASFRKNNGR